jgi:hypothetical protein
MGTSALRIDAPGLHLRSYKLFEQGEIERLEGQTCELYGVADQLGRGA